jgi:hypothetical protein
VLSDYVRYLRGRSETNPEPPQVPSLVMDSSRLHVLRIEVKHSVQVQVLLIDMTGTST